MLKEVRGTKASGRAWRAHGRLFTWNPITSLTLLALLFGLLAGCGRGTATATPPQSPSPSGTWIELAPGVRYWEGEGRFSLDISPPLLTEESVRVFREFAQKRMAQATHPEEKASWEESLRFVEEQHALWSNEELVVTALENAFLERNPLPLEEAQRQELRAKLREILRQMKRYGPDNLPPGGEIYPQH